VTLAVASPEQQARALLSRYLAEWAARWPRWTGRGTDLARGRAIVEAPAAIQLTFLLVALD
jgi:hypothetical protein